MNTVNSNVINFLESIGCGTFGTDLYFGRVPQSTQTPTALWWVAPITSKHNRTNVTGEDTITYDYALYYRDMSMKRVDEKIFQAIKAIVSNHCYNLNDFQTMAVSFGSSTQGLEVDSENRVLGRIDFQVKVYDIAN